MKRWRKGQIIANLAKQGFVFSDFNMVHEGHYAVADADWNYKDVPHLHHTHQQVEAIFTVMDDDFIATINAQKVFGFNLPLSMMNYQSAPNEQTYYTTWLFFILIIQTRYEKISANQTRVITNYNIGSSKWLRWCHPLIRFIIKRNYKTLMAADIPMRERRGQLRDWGYQFYKDSEYYSFPKTMEILQENVVLPAAAQEFSDSLDINMLLPADGEYLYGRDDHRGLRIIRSGHILSLYQRLCPHEGASLDQAKCHNKQLQCPWHGRLLAPIAQIDLQNPGLQQFDAKYFHIEWQHGQLRVRTKATASVCSSIKEV